MRARAAGYTPRNRIAGKVARLFDCPIAMANNLVNATARPYQKRCSE